MPFYLLDNVLPFAEIALVQLRPRSSVMPFIQRRTDCIFVPNIICEYLDEICAKPSPLLSFDPYLRAVQRQWANFASSNLLPLVSAALATASADHAALLLALKSVNKALHELSDSGPFFCGKAFTLVDCAMAPAVRAIDKLSATGRLAIADELEYDRLADYVTALLKHEAVRSAATVAAFPAS